MCVTFCINVGSNVCCHVAKILRKKSPIATLTKLFAVFHRQSIQHCELHQSKVDRKYCWPIHILSASQWSNTERSTSSHDREGRAYLNRDAVQIIAYGLRTASLLKSCSDMFAPIIARLANLSFADGLFPTNYKRAQITPLLKKEGLDKVSPANYRPISNLNTISKIIEKYSSVA